MCGPNNEVLDAANSDNHTSEGFKVTFSQGLEVRFTYVMEGSLSRASGSRVSESRVPEPSVTGEKKEEQAKPQEAKPQEAKPNEAKPQEAKPQEAKPEEAKPEEAKPEKSDSPRSLTTVVSQVVPGSWAKVSAVPSEPRSPKGQPQSLSPERERVPESRVPDDLDDARYSGSSTLVALQTKRAAAMAVGAVVSPQPRLDQAGDDDLDITSMNTSHLERVLHTGGQLPGWNQAGDPTKDLAYVKIFFQAKIMNYDGATLWPATTLEASLRPQLQDLVKQFANMHRDGSMVSLPAQSQYDLKVIEVWTQHMCGGVVPHGPLLGWARMQGHELYYHVYSENIAPFLMARVPGGTYNTHPGFLM